MTKLKKQTDKFLVFIRSMNIVVWSIIFTAMLFFEKARPQTKTILDMHYSKSIRKTWDLDFLQPSLWLFIAAAIIALFGLLVNLGFLHDHKYHISYGLVISFILSFSASLAFILLLM